MDQQGGEHVSGLLEGLTQCTLCGMHHTRVWTTMFGDYCQACINNPPHIRLKLRPSDSGTHVDMEVIHGAN